MAYGFTEATKTSGGGSFIDDAGIYDVRLDSVNYENSKNDGSGKNVIIFRFTTQDGSSFRHIEWDIDENQIRTAQSGYYDTAQKSGKPFADKNGRPYEKAEYLQLKIDQEYENQGARIKHIFETYGGGGEIKATSYTDYANKVVAAAKALPNAGEYKPLLIVFNAKEYASLPKFTPFFGTRPQLEALIVKKKYVMTRKAKDDDSGGFSAPATGSSDDF